MCQSFKIISKFLTKSNNVSFFYRMTKNLHQCTPMYTNIKKPPKCGKAKFWYFFLTQSLTDFEIQTMFAFYAKGQKNKLCEVYTRV